MFLQPKNNLRSKKLPPELPKAALNLYNILDKIVLCAYLNYRANKIVAKSDLKKKMIKNN